VDGLLVRPGDVEALAEAMRRLAKDAGFRAQLGRAAAKRAACFLPEVVARDIMAVYRQILEGNENGPMPANGSTYVAR